MTRSIQTGSVDLIGGSDVTSRDPEKAARIANRAAEA
jgi:hypothetical protein